MTHLEKTSILLREYTAASHLLPKVLAATLALRHRLERDSRMVRVVSRRSISPLGPPHPTRTRRSARRHHPQLFGSASSAANPIISRSAARGPRLCSPWTTSPHREREAAVAPPRLEVAAEGSPTIFPASRSSPATAPTDAVPNPPPSKAESGFALYGIVQRLECRPRGTEHPPSSAPVASPTGSSPARYAQDHRDNRNTRRPEALRPRTRPVAALKSPPDTGARSGPLRRRLRRPGTRSDWYLNQYRLACCLKPGKWPPAFSATGPAGDRHRMARRLPHELQHPAGVVGRVLE